MFRPVSNACTFCLPQGRHRNGFALIVALALMSFLLLLLVTLGTLLQLEIHSGTHDRNLALARENARLGLMMALGELQKHAGPDQRITARAEILGGSVTGGNRFWTGVWDATDPSAAPVWLVSGDPASLDPESTTGDTLLVGAGSSGAETDQHVRVQSVDTREDGFYAWWIADEGVKANLAAGFKPGANPNPLPLDRRGSDYSLGVGLGYDAFGMDSELPFTETGDINLAVNRLIWPMQIHLLGNLIDNPAEENFHAITTHSRSVLQRPEGGLKLNLADRAVLENSRLGEAGWNFLQAGASLSAHSNIVNVEDVDAGEAYFDPLPIPTEIALYMGMFQTWSDARVRVRYHLQVEMWNPYPRPLRFPVDTHPGYNRALVVEFENLPKFTIEDLGSTLEPPVAPVLENSLNAMYGGSNNNLVLESIKSWVDVEPDSPRGRPPFQPGLSPGEIYNVLEPNPDVQKRGLARNVINFDADSSMLWSGSQNQRPDNAATIRITFEPNDDGPVNIIIRKWNATGTGRVLARFENLPFFADEFAAEGNYILEKKFNEGPNPFSRSQSGTYERDDYNLAFHVRFKSDENDPGALDYFFSTLDSRIRTFDYDGFFTNQEGEQVPMSDILDSVSWNPVVAQQLDGDIFSELDVLHSQAIREHGPNNNSILAYDLPRNAATVGAFRGISIKDRPAVALGAPWGQDVNDLYDAYYFAPDGSFGGLGTNHWIVDAYSPSNAADLEAPAKSLLEGGFNINSTSPDAWTSLLSVSLRDGTNGSISHGFFRTPYYAAAENKELAGPWPDDGSGLPTLEEAYNLAGRRLTDDQLRAIGEIIAARIRMQADEPFTSIAAFVNAGVIDDAIAMAHDADQLVAAGYTDVQPAATAINPDGILEHSHGFLTQGDIMARIGHLLNQRSDTFVIRAYGDTRNFISGEIDAKAVLEAVVQRLPEKVDESDPMLSTPPTEPNDFGRQFKILALRWLDAGEI